MRDEGQRLKRHPDRQSRVRWVQPLLLGTGGLALLCLFSSKVVVRPAGDEAKGLVARRSTHTVAQTRPSLGSAGSHFAPVARTPGTQAGSALRSEPERNRWKLRVLASHLRRMKVITAEEATYIKRALRDLRNDGAAAVPAIGDFLRQGGDVDFAKMGGGQLVGHRTLRQAMIDTLGQIGGSEAMAVSLEEIQRTSEPIEVVMLARSLEREEPGLHSGQVIQAIGGSLQAAAQAPAHESPDVSPLFDLLRTYPGEQALAVLENSAPHWREYALIALACLPDGAGIPSLTALANSTDAAVANRILPFQTLAQASVHYAQAGDALVDLARAGQIPDEVWGAMGEVLEGKQLQFSGRMFEGTPLAESTASDGRPPLWRSYYVEWLNVRYEQDVVSAGWSAEQVAHQLALIDDLGEVASSPAAVQALLQARASLQRARRDGES